MRRTPRIKPYPIKNSNTTLSDTPSTSYYKSDVIWVQIKLFLSVHVAALSQHYCIAEICTAHIAKLASHLGLSLQSESIGEVSSFVHCTNAVSPILAQCIMRRRARALHCLLERLKSYTNTHKSLSEWVTLRLTSLSLGRSCSISILMGCGSISWRGAKSFKPIRDAGGRESPNHVRVFSSMGQGVRFTPRGVRKSEGGCTFTVHLWFPRYIFELLLKGFLI